VNLKTPVAATSQRRFYLIWLQQKLRTISGHECLSPISFPVVLHKHIPICILRFRRHSSESLSDYQLIWDISWIYLASYMNVQIFPSNRPERNPYLSTHISWSPADISQR